MPTEMRRRMRMMKRKKVKLMLQNGWLDVIDMVE
jgi:hypothetical protein